MTEEGGLAGETPGEGVGDGDADPRVLLRLGPEADIATGPISGGQVSQRRDRQPEAHSEIPGALKCQHDR